MKKFLVLSVFIHITIFSGFSLIEIKSEQTRQGHQIIQINFAEFDQVKSSLANSNTRTWSVSLGRAEFKKRFFNLNSYSKNFSRPSGQNQREERVSDVKHKGWFSSENYDLNELSAYENMTIPEINFTKELWGEVFSHIENNPYLAEYGISGRVFLSLRLDPSGNIVSNSVKAKSDDKILKVIALRSIRKALLNQNKSIHFLNNSYSLNFKFSWVENCSGIGGFNKNYLSFCRYSKSEKKKYDALEKTTTYLSSIKYGFSAYEAIKEYNKQVNRHNTKFDPFDSYRQDPDWDI